MRILAIEIVYITYYKTIAICFSYMSKILCKS